jgi:hypothetical protein
MFQKFSCLSSEFIVDPSNKSLFTTVRSSNLADLKVIYYRRIYLGELNKTTIILSVYSFRAQN